MEMQKFYRLFEHVYAYMKKEAEADEEAITIALLPDGSRIKVVTIHWYHDRDIISLVGRDLDTKQKTGCNVALGDVFFKHLIVPKQESAAGFASELNRKADAKDDAD